MVSPERFLRRGVAAAACLTSALAFAQTPPRVVVAAAPGWTTTIAALNTSAAAISVPLTDCISPRVTLDLAPGSAGIARHVERFLCALSGGFGLIDAPAGGTIESRLTSRDEAGNATAFYAVPALRVALKATGDSARVRMVSNDDVEQTYVVIFGDPGPLTMEVFNEDGQLLRTEVVEATRFDRIWDVLVYPIEQHVEVGSVRITAGDKQHPNRPLPDETYYGFALIAARDGSSQLVRPWEQP
jgi:hypothetical protein